MDPDSAHAEAEDLLDRAAERAQRWDASPELLAQLGIGYAMLALIDEIDLLRRELREHGHQQQRTRWFWP